MEGMAGRRPTVAEAAAGTGRPPPVGAPAFPVGGTGRGVGTHSPRAKRGSEGARER